MAHQGQIINAMQLLGKKIKSKLRKTHTKIIYKYVNVYKAQQL